MADVATAQGVARDRDQGNKSWLTSTVLILFTLLVANACVVGLACTLTQTRVASLAIDGVAISIPKLDFVGRRWVAQRDDSKDLFQLEQDELNLGAKAANAGILVGNANRDLENRLKIFSHSIEQKFPDLAKALAAADTPERYGRIMGNKTDLVGKDAALTPLIEAIEQAYSRFLNANDDLSALATQGAQTNARLALLRKRADQVFDTIKPNLDKDNRTRVENTFYELNIDKFRCGKANDDCGPFGGFIDRGLYHVLTLRPDLLTLTLVILMGVLGSTLQITHAYFMKNQTQSIGGFFQRVTVGAMTALVIFIVAKAGVPVLADTSRLGGDAPINPYLISFLAIVSGLLSENAIANIQVQGTRFLGSGGGTTRWARHDLTPALQAQNMTVEALAGHLGVTKTVAEGMLKGDDPIDAQQQKIVALGLRDDPRAIFTDIAPPASAATAS